MCVRESVCVCECVSACVSVRERERERERNHVIAGCVPKPCSRLVPVCWSLRTCESSAPAADTLPEHEPTPSGGGVVGGPGPAGDSTTTLLQSAPPIQMLMRQLTHTHTHTPKEKKLGIHRNYSFVK
ncbi:hypothetical protein AMELA_G00015900 [Ameiurus melas]|uniref:Uncharacterized protein n=1 Tax=Ameiurus melas TaxID=219545 RepID=A0A7J6BDZ4_AMEME|nr:hypothetical protein AMELA_G00015900 [Ameiurus melas]